MYECPACHGRELAAEATVEFDLDPHTGYPADIGDIEGLLDYQVVFCQSCDRQGPPEDFECEGEE